MDLTTSVLNVSLFTSIKLFQIQRTIILFIFFKREK